jgi:hypothetical protein
MAAPKKPVLDQLTGTLGAIAALIGAVAALLVAWTQWGGSGEGAAAAGNEVVATNMSGGSGSNASASAEPGPPAPPDTDPGNGGAGDAPAPASGPSPDHPDRAILDNPQMALILVRAEPSSTSAEVGQIHPGEVVYVGEAVNGWRPVRTRSGVTGWTRAGNLTVVGD